MWFWHKTKTTTATKNEKRRKKKKLEGKTNLKYIREKGQNKEKRIYTT